MRGQLVEFDYLITPDGLEYQFNTMGQRFLVSEVSPLGMPGIDVQTQRSPFQHGETALTYALRPRLLTMVQRRQGCSRQDFWDLRQDMINHMRPNRQTAWGAYEPCHLVKVLPNLRKWALDVYWTGGLEFRAKAEWDEWSAQDAIRFTAYDPTFYDLDTTVHNFNLIASGSEWCFPMCFPICFQAEDTLDQTVVITYTGTWQAFPLIEIDGPIENVIITNIDTGEKLELQYSIPIGDTVTIDCRTGQKTVVNLAGVNLVGVLSDDSDLGTFHPAPDPESPGGQNTINVFGLDTANGATEVRFYYNTRMIGL